MTPSHLASRWKCPKCSSCNVQVSYPAWYRETQDYTLTPVDTDYEAEVLYWYCEDCMESDDGSPVDTNSTK